MDKTNSDTLIDICTTCLHKALVNFDVDVLLYTTMCCLVNYFYIR